MRKMCMAAVLAGVFCLGAQAAGAAGEGTVPILYTTDLYHPHDDPDDHYDLATLFAIPQFDIRGIVIDTGPRGNGRPGLLPVRQMDHLTGRKVTCVTGLTGNLTTPTDDGSKQPKEAQPGVELILEVLRESKEPVTVFTVGSLRDVAAAYNREPALLKEKIGRLYVNAGHSGGGEEWNVKLDRHAYVRILRSDLPIYWMPCFGVDGYETLWKFRQGDVLGDAPVSVQNFFLYALRRLSEEERDPLNGLKRPLDKAAAAEFWTLDRNMWCTAGFLHAVGIEDATFSFKPIRIDVADDGKTPQRKEGGYEVLTFHVESDGYRAAMENALRGLLKRFPCEAPSAHVIQDADWVVHVEEGRAGDPRAYKLVPSRSPLENYYENLKIICGSTAGEMPKTAEHPLHPSNLTVREVGKWYDYTVFDISNTEAKHKSIILKDMSGRCRILYTQFHWCTASAGDLPFLVKVNDQSVLAYKTRVPGTGGFFIEYYFVYDEKTELPCRLSLAPIHEKLRAVLPEGRAVSKGGGFNVQKMTYSHAVWKENDGNCCPSGGRIDLQLGLRDNKLVVTDAVYDPKYEWR